MVNLTIEKNISLKNILIQLKFLLKKIAIELNQSNNR